MTEPIRTSPDVVPGDGSRTTLALQMDAVTRVPVGVSTTIPLRVLNTSDWVVAAHVEVAPADVAAWFRPAAPVALYPRDSSVVDLEVTVPRELQGTGPRVPFTVQVTCEIDDSQAVVAAELLVERAHWPVPAARFPPTADEAPGSEHLEPPPAATRVASRRRLLPWTWWRGRVRQSSPPPAQVAHDERALVVLSDQPVGRYEDELGYQTMAEQLARIVLSPATSTPFTVGVEGGWGSGKSTLMRLVEEVLGADAAHTATGSAPVRVRTVRYNAWTAEGASALSGLIRSVLPELDPSVLRRLVRRGRSSWWVGPAISLVAATLGVGHLVDVIWRRFGVDKETRNEMRSQLFSAMDEWVHAGLTTGQLRRLVVFVDDLDRCSPENIREVFEAIRVYLDAPGFVFVIGYDAAVVNDRLLNSADGASTPWRAYLEKIIQVDFHLPPPDADQLHRLARACVRRSRADDLLGEEELALIAQRSDRNPRRLKRFLNAFVLARQLDTATAQLTPGEHVRVLLFQIYFPAFHRLLLDETEVDPFADVQLLARAAAPGADDDPTVRSALAELCLRRGVAPPSGDELLDHAVRRLAPALPQAIVELALDRQLLTLVWKVGEPEQRQSLLRRLRERPAAVKELPPAPVVFLCQRCGTANSLTSPTCRTCGQLVWVGASPVGVVPPIPVPSVDLSLIGKFVVLYDRSGGGHGIAEALSVRGAVVSVTDTVRSTTVAIDRRPVLSAVVWVTQVAVTETAVAEQERHLEAVIALVRTTRRRLPVVVWGPAHSLADGPTTGSDVLVMSGGATEESLVATLAGASLRSTTRPSAG